MIFRRMIARSVILTTALTVSAFANAAGRMALTPWMVAHAGTASTCDLLPSNSSPKLGERVADFTSTQRPVSCTQSTSRRLERPLARHLELQHSLSNAPQLSAAVTLASATDLARPSRVLSRAEILAALATSASVNQFSGLQALRVEDIVSAPDIFVVEAAPQIEITSIEPDLKGTATRARLWIPSEPRIPPFWVTLRRVITPTPDFAPNVAPNAAAIATAPRSVALSQGVLIARGKPVRLLLQGTGFRISATGTALEAGREGQRIRVRSDFAGKVVLATVLNAETVELEY
jgi:hypothetical protein